MIDEKSILQRIHPPMLVDEKCEITSDEIDVAGKLSSVVIDAGEYRSFEVMNAELTDFSAPNVICYRASLLRSIFMKGQLTGLQVPDAHIKDVVFSNCRINLSNFRKTTFERCAFIECDLREADFAGAQLKSIHFENCEIAGADLSNTQCKRVEFHHTNLSDLKGISGLQGATISESNLIEIAPLLAHELGIVVT